LVSSFRKDIDKFIIPVFLGMATLGQFTLSIQIYSGLMLIPLVLNRFLLAEESAGFSTGKLLKIAIIIQSIVSVLAIILLPTVLPEFFPQYIETVEMIPIISLSIIPGTLFGLLIARATANKDNRILIFATIIQIVVLITGIMTMGISLGAVGLGISHLLSYTFATIFILIMKKSYLKN
jgi:O-antigen/teichoic acid export membrane protein